MWLQSASAVHTIIPVTGQTPPMASGAILTGTHSTILTGQWPGAVHSGADQTLPVLLRREYSVQPQDPPSNKESRLHSLSHVGNIRRPTLPYQLRLNLHLFQAWPNFFNSLLLTPSSTTSSPRPSSSHRPLLWPSLCSPSISPPSSRSPGTRPTEPIEHDPIIQRPIWNRRDGTSQAEEENLRLMRELIR